LRDFVLFEGGYEFFAVLDDVGREVSPFYLTFVEGLLGVLLLLLHLHQRPLHLRQPITRRLITGHLRPAIFHDQLEELGGIGFEGAGVEAYDGGAFVDEGL